jgi:DNA-binding MarR family transcriptional regulator
MSAKQRTGPPKTSPTRAGSRVQPKPLAANANAKTPPGQPVSKKVSAPAPSGDDPAYGVVEPLAALVRWARIRCYEEIAARSNEKLDRSAMNILGTLKLQGPKRTSDLADILGLDRSTVSRQVSAAIELGLVVRDEDEHDARAAFISLSDQGRAKQQKIAHAWQGIAMDLVSDWDYAEQQEIARLLAKLVAKIEI